MLPLMPLLPASAPPPSHQVHDLWHVLFGCHTNGFGEVALKAVEFVQVGAGWRNISLLPPALWC